MDGRRKGSTHSHSTASRWHRRTKAGAGQRCRGALARPRGAGPYQRRRGPDKTRSRRRPGSRRSGDAGRLTIGKRQRPRAVHAKAGWLPQPPMQPLRKRWRHVAAAAAVAAAHEQLLYLCNKPKHMPDHTQPAPCSRCAAAARWPPLARRRAAAAAAASVAAAAAAARRRPACKQRGEAEARLRTSLGCAGARRRRHVGPSAPEPHLAALPPAAGAAACRAPCSCCWHTVRCICACGERAGGRGARAPEVFGAGAVGGAATLCDECLDVSSTD